MKKSTQFVLELGVGDIQSVLDFYVDILGCKLLEIEKDERGIPFWAEISSGTSRLMFERLDYLSKELSGVSNETGKPNFALVMRIKPVTYAKALLEKLREKECSVETGPIETDYGSYEFSFRDPAGYVIVVSGRD